MKKICCILLTLSVVLLFSGCGSERYVPQENINYNYNNITASRWDLWLTTDTCYHVDMPFMSAYCYQITPKGQKRLLIDTGTFITKIQLCGDTLYVLDDYGTTEDHKSLHRLSTFNTRTRKQKKLDSFENVRNCFVVDGYMYYWRYNEAADDIVYILNRYNLADGSEECISDSILTCGVSNGIPMYVVQSGDTFTVYSYDADNDTSDAVGMFHYTLAQDERIEAAWNINFTLDMFIFEVYSEQSPRLVSFRFSDGRVFEYCMNEDIDSAVAYENYVFVSLVDTNETGDSDEWDNIIYRVCLEDGEKEKIADLDGIVRIYVASDECVYVYSSIDSKNLYRYDLNGEKTLVCTW